MPSIISSSESRWGAVRVLPGLLSLVLKNWNASEVDASPTEPGQAESVIDRSWSGDDRPARASSPDSISASALGDYA